MKNARKPASPDLHVFISRVGVGERGQIKTKVSAEKKGVAGRG